MRFRTISITLVLALICASPLAVTGQEEPLPVVQPKAAAFTLGEPTVYLDVEPARTAPEITLASAARDNDYVSFDALYGQASARDRAAFDSLHELWSYSINNPIGAFYGREMYERYAAAYPGFSEFIAGYKIVDSNGNTFYPTQETRSFLLQRIEQGRTSPRVLLADASPRAAVATPRRTAASPSKAAAPPVRTSPRRRMQKAELTAPAATIAPAPASATAPAPVAVAAAPAASIAAPSVTAAPPADASAAPQTIVTKAALVTPRQPVPQSLPPQRPGSGRGLLLLVIGIVGIGVLAVILRTPKEAQPTSILHPAEDDAKKVEPIRKTG